MQKLTSSLVNVTFPQELEKKVQDTADFLNQLKGKMGDLMKDAQQRADTQLQNALSQVDRFSQDVNNFQARVSACVCPQN